MDEVEAVAERDKEEGKIMARAEGEMEDQTEEGGRSKGEAEPPDKEEEMTLSESLGGEEVKKQEVTAEVEQQPQFQELTMDEVSCIVLHSLAICRVVADSYDRNDPRPSPCASWVPHRCADEGWSDSATCLSGHRQTLEEWLPKE